jgi:hypothetical protein
MKMRSSKMKLISICLLLFTFGISVADVPTYTAFLQNDLMVSSTVYEFDLYLTRTGVTPLELANFQAAITVNSSFVNGGTITPTIVSGSSDLNASQWPTSIAFSSSQNCIKIAPKAPPRTLNPATHTSVTNGTIISTSGTRVCRIRLTNSVAFGSSPINPVWSFTIQPYRTSVTAYIGPVSNKVNTLITLAEAHSKTLNLSVFTEGLFDPETGLMRKTQNVDETFTTWDNFPGLTVDTLTVQLAEANSPWNIICSAHGVNLNTNGKCRVPVPGNITGNYFIIVNHRNSLETWSKLGGESFSSSITSFDLSTSAAQAFGNNLKQVSSSKYALYSGDVDSSEPGEKDGYIEFFDLNSIYNLNVMNAYGYMKQDITGDGFVDFYDLNMVYNNNVNNIGINSPPNPGGKKK